MTAMLASLPVPLRLIAVVVIAVLVHLVAKLARSLVLATTRSLSRARYAKLQTMVQLLFGVMVFSIYFLALGALLSVFGISLTAYLATASVIGLAVGFGSQTIVQDVISGLTVILSDLVQIGDMVEISGQTGIVQSVGMRFTVIQNAMGAMVFVPNRSLTSMTNYPRGYIRCLVDIELGEDEALNQQIEALLGQAAAGISEQFPAVMRAPSEIEGRRQTSTGKIFLRLKFRLWPGRGSVIETTFKQELLASIRKLDPDFSDGRLTINYEVEQTTPVARG